MDYKEKVIALLNSQELSNEQKEKLESIFPELKESEDERIRKELIFYLRYQHSISENFEDIGKWIAWLEKQESEPNWCHHKVDLSNCSEEYRKAYYDGWNNCNMQHSQCKSESNDVVKCLINGMKFYYEDNTEATWGTEKFSMKVKDILAWLEKQGEQKSADKVEPKFHEGDWVVSPNGVYWHIDAIQNGRYEVTADTGQCGNWPLDTNIYRLWTIQDAKDGEVLYECNEKKPFIFKELETKHIGDIASYCDIFDGIFNPNEDDWTTLDVVPATKEQRDTLFKAMADAGYTFDFEKKELRKIEHKPAVWSEEDKKVIHCLEYAVKHFYEDEDTIKWCYDWLKSLKDKIQPQPKQEWSKEDERILNQIIKDYEKANESWLKGQGSLPFGNRIKWLKSLRPQNHWKPTEEHMRHLWLAAHGDTRANVNYLIDLYNDLKKLTE